MPLDLIEIRQAIEAREAYLKRCLSILEFWHESNETVESKKLIEQEVFFLQDQLDRYYQAARLLQEEQANEQALLKTV